MGLGDTSRIPRFIEAMDSKELEAKMLRLQLLSGREYEWTIIPFKGKIQAWYRERAEVVRQTQVRGERDPNGR